jgi:predicted TIM-barrel fold metal-dependent hydrolase
MDNANVRIFDADNHMYETRDALKKYLPERYQREIEFVEVRGRTRIALQGLITDYIPNPTFDVVAAPGAHMAFFSGHNPEGLTLRQMTGEPIRSIPAFREPAPRLELMDQLGVDRALMFPTLANLVEQRLSDPDLCHAAIHALNQWMHEVWSFNYQGRILATPVIHLGLVDRAVAELEWVLARGAKVVLIRPAPARGYHGFRSIALEEFDPFWARVQEAGVPVAIHATEPIITDYVRMWEPATSDSAFKPGPFREVTIAHRDIEDTLASLVCHGMLSRFPGLKILSVENGADWVEHLLAAFRKAHNRMPQEFAEHPVEVFQRNVWVNPFWEDDLEDLVGLIGPDHVIFGSDFPHPEGLADPREFLPYLAGFDDDTVTGIMGGNVEALLPA